MPLPVCDADRNAVEQVVADFFAAFASGAGLSDRMATLRELLLPEAVIVRTCGADFAVYDVDGFIAPRAAVLADPAVDGFTEWPLEGHLDLVGDVAQWFGGYAKSWHQDGILREGRGTKSIQVVRTSNGWRISAVAWDDER